MIFADKMLVIQLLVGNMRNFSYIIHDGENAIIIDPSFGGKEIIGKLEELSLSPLAIISTHRHFDHNMDNLFLKSKLGVKIYAHYLSTIEKDVSVKEGEELEFGNISVKILHTPGHTPDSICIAAGNALFTGDTLFVGTCGRADLPESNPEQLFKSLRRLKSLEPSTIIYPGHDYGNSRTSTIGEAKSNPALILETLPEFLSYIT